MTLYLKWTRPGRVPSYQGGQPIPVGEWTERVPDPVLCERGWHACRWEDVAAHIAAELWVVALDGVIVEGDDKVVAERLKLIRQVPVTDAQWRHFAADCAESVLHLFERTHPGDDRPRKAIEAARLFADGQIDAAELAAARSAAASAAWSAVWSAARSPARSAAESAARSASWSASWSAAESAARSAAESAARSVARSAAWSAARSTMLLTRLGLDPSLFAHRTVTS